MYRAVKISDFLHRKKNAVHEIDKVESLHACLRYVQRDYLTNSSLRERFGIEKENSAMVSRVIRDALEEEVIKPVDPESESRKLARYWPKLA